MGTYMNIKIKPRIGVFSLIPIMSDHHKKERILLPLLHRVAFQNRATIELNGKVQTCLANEVLKERRNRGRDFHIAGIKKINVNSCRNPK